MEQKKKSEQRKVAAHMHIYAHNNLVLHMCMCVCVCFVTWVSGCNPVQSLFPENINIRCVVVSDSFHIADPSDIFMYITIYIYICIYI